jgi:hypothetical protein
MSFNAFCSTHLPQCKKLLLLPFGASFLTQSLAAVMPSTSTLFVLNDSGVSSTAEGHGQPSAEAPLTSSATAHISEDGDEAALDRLLAVQLANRQQRQQRARVVHIEHSLVRPSESSQVAGEVSVTGFSSSIDNVARSLGDSSVAWCFELLRSGFNSNSMCVVMIALDNQPILNSEENDHDSFTPEFMSILENCIAVVAPGSLFAFFSQTAPLQSQKLMWIQQRMWQEIGSSFEQFELSSHGESPPISSTMRDSQIIALFRLRGR